jgi:hypothetical protein
MAQNLSMRPVGPTYALSVTNAQHATVQIQPVQADIVNYATFYNTSTNTICVACCQSGQTVPTLGFPTDGTPTAITSFVLGPNQDSPLIVAVPANGFGVSAIASAAGPSNLYVTPVSSAGT